MRWAVVTLAALALVAGCNKSPEGSKAAPRTDASPVSSPSTASTPTPAASTGATASATEKKDGANPQQGQVDPKSPAQQRDFKQDGDGAGPKPGG
jgi:hypothetical protein